MNKKWRLIAGGSAAVCAGLGVVTWIASRRQQNALAMDVERLMRAAPAQADAAPIADLAVDSVPAPVARYLRLALPRARPIQRVRMRQVGSLRAAVDSERWMAFAAEHTVVPAATGFVWNARVRIGPLLHVGVRDTLIAGSGSGQVNLLSAFPVSADGGSPEMTSGSLHRYLAEAVWYPTALLPSPNLRWTAIDGSKALATLTHHGTAVSLEFRFAASGAVSGIYTPQRWGTFAEGYRQAPWEGHFRDYRERDGIVVPTEGDVGWYVDGEWRAVWQGRITAFEVTPAR